MDSRIYSAKNSFGFQKILQKIRSCFVESDFIRHPVNKKNCMKKLSLALAGLVALGALASFSLQDERKTLHHL
jgi:hypothetical protein